MAQVAYSKHWQTANLIDGNDLGVVVLLNQQPVGNLNVQLKKDNLRLQSEVFFQPNHWKNFYNGAEKIAELSALAIELERSHQMWPLILKALILGAHELCYLYHIKFLATIQRQLTVKIFSRLGLPLVKNERVKKSSNIPNDRYWTSKPFPALYYLNPFALKTIEQCEKFSFEIQKQVKTTFVCELEGDRYFNTRKAS
ncbi:MAG: hypothetical protein HC820_00380 [Hydrococcus sp. RM1_1_31]|nr:hypothetical protein [Hydrococcus sp. RM1_1_31]